MWDQIVWQLAIGTDARLQELELAIQREIEADVVSESIIHDMQQEGDQLLHQLHSYKLPAIRSMA